MDRRVCANCLTRVANYSAQLCRRCYGVEGVRVKYPRGPSGNRGLGVGTASHRLKEPEPTEHLPGTEGKVRVLEERVFRGERLWSARDAGEDAT